MKTWDNLKHGDKVKNIENGEVFEVYIWRGEKYLASDNSMWFVTDFDCKDWEILEQKGE